MSEADAILKAARIDGAGSAAIVKAIGLLAQAIVQISDRQQQPAQPSDFERIVTEAGLDWNSLVELTTP